MAKAKIQTLLKRLHAEIDQQPALRPQDRERIDKLVQDIEQGLQEQAAGETLNESLSGTIAELEASYPRLTGIINDIMVQLANMGI